MRYVLFRYNAVVFCIINMRSEQKKEKGEGKREREREKRGGGWMGERRRERGGRGDGKRHGKERVKVMEEVRDVEVRFVILPHN